MGARRAAGTAAPTVGLGVRRAVGDCRPYRWLGAAGGRGLPPLPLGWGRRGRQGTAAPTIGLGARRAKHVAER